MLSLLISDLILCSCCSHYWYLFNLIFRRSFIRIMSENNCSHKNELSNIFGEPIEWLLDMKQLYVNEISHRRFYRIDKNYMSTILGSGAWYSETCCINTFEGCLTVHLHHEIRWNANLMQQSNVITMLHQVGILLYFIALKHFPETGLPSDHNNNLK